MPLLIAFLQVIEREIVFCFCGCVAVATGVFWGFVAEFPEDAEPEPLEAPLFPAFPALPFVGWALPDGVCVFVAAFVGNAAGYVRLNLAMPRATLETGLERICRLLNSER